MRGGRERGRNGVRERWRDGETERERAGGNGRKGGRGQLVDALPGTQPCPEIELYTSRHVQETSYIPIILRRAGDRE